MRKKWCVIFSLLLIVMITPLGYSETFGDIYDELKAENPEVIDALKSRDATDEDIKNFLSDLATEVSKEKDLNEGNIREVLKKATREVIFENPDDENSTVAKVKYQSIAMAYLDQNNIKVLVEAKDLQNKIKNKILNASGTPSEDTPSSGGGTPSGGGGPVSSGGGGAVTSSGSPSSGTMFDRSSSNGVVKLKVLELKSLLEQSADKKNVAVDLTALDLNKGEKLELKTLKDAINSDKKVTLNLGSVKLTVTKGNDEVLENTLDIQYANDKLKVSLGDTVTDLNKPFKFQMPVPSGADKSGLTVAKVLADGSFEAIGGYFSGETVTFFTDKPGQYVVINNPVAFDDLEIDDYWAAQKVERLASLGIISGKGEGDFDPAANISRAEFSALVTKMMKLDGGTMTQTFSDLDDAAWYAPYVKTASAFGLMNGKAKDTFDPNGEITQQEILTVLSKLLEEYDVMNGSVESDSSYEMKTKTAATWAKPLIQTAISNGALRGMPLGNVDMSRAATRLETANMLYEIQSVLYQ